MDSPSAVPHLVESTALGKLPSPGDISTPSQNTYVHPLESLQDSSNATDYSSFTSQPGSVSAKSTPSNRSVLIEDIKHEIMVNHLYQQQCSHLWVSDSSGECEGVLLRKSKGHYLACPQPLLNSTFARMCTQLNVSVRNLSTLRRSNANHLQVAVTVNSRVIKTFLAWAPGAKDVPLMNGLRVQILSSMDELSQARIYQFAAFVTSESLLIVWDDDPSNVIERATKIEAELMQLVWQTEEMNSDDAITMEKIEHSERDVDNEPIETMLEHRSTNLMNTNLVACTLVIVVVLLGLACRSLATEITVDGQYFRLAFLSLVPVQVFFTLVSKLPICGPLNSD